VQYGEANGKRLLLDAYVRRDGETARPAVVLIHGGGFRVGDKASFAPEASRLAERGWVAFSVNYRLDEPSVYPAEADDVQSAVRWIRAHAREYGVDAARLGALGESAGGTLAAMLATVGRGALDAGARIRVGVAWSGPMDLSALARSRGDQWGVPLMGCSLAACPDRFAQASPITQVDRSDAPLYLVNSTEELVPLSQTQAMDTELRRAGVAHDVQVLPGNRHALDYRDEAFPRSVQFLDQHLRRPAGRSPGTLAFFATVVVVAMVAAIGLFRWSRGGRGAQAVH
jgi:acetyl esterase/lipase